MKNEELFTTNNEVHQHGTKQTNNFHFPLAKLQKYQSEVFYMGGKLYNSLPPYIKVEFHNTTKFETLLKKFLLKHNFYSPSEFLQFCIRASYVFINYAILL